MSYKILWLLFSIGFLKLKACDICGNNPNSMYIGLLPNYSSHFLGIKHRYVRFDTEHNDKQEFGKDALNEWNLWGRYQLSRKIQIYASVPYLVTDRVDNHNDYTIHGLGDISILANYTLIDNSDSMNTKTYHLLQSGLGVKLPTGQSDIIANSNTVIPMLQLGTGSADLLANIFYMMRSKKLGWSIDGNYKWNTTGTNAYRMGNSLNMNLRGFYWYQTPKMAWVPNLGLSWEHNESNIDRGVKNELTGGNSILGAIGVNWFKGKISIGGQVFIPMYQNINSGFTQGSIRVSSQINYFF